MFIYISNNNLLNMKNNKFDNFFRFIATIIAMCIMCFAMFIAFGCHENINTKLCLSNKISTVTPTFYFQKQKNCTKCTDVICKDWCTLSETTNMRKYVCIQNCTGGCEDQPTQCYDIFVNFKNNNDDSNCSALANSDNPNMTDSLIIATQLFPMGKTKKIYSNDKTCQFTTTNEEKLRLYVGFGSLIFAIILFIFCMCCVWCEVCRDENKTNVTDVISTNLKIPVTVPTREDKLICVENVVISHTPAKVCEHNYSPRAENVFVSQQTHAVNSFMV